MSLRLTLYELPERSPKPKCQAPTARSETDLSFLLSSQSWSLIQQSFPAFLKVQQNPLWKSQRTYDKRRQLSFRAVQIRPWAFSPRKDPSCLLGPSEAHTALCGYVPSASNCKALQLINSSDENTVGSREGPEYTIIWIVGISNNILMFSCLKLCSGFVAILSTHLGFFFFLNLEHLGQTFLGPFVALFFFKWGLIIIFQGWKHCTTLTDVNLSKWVVFFDAYNNGHFKELFTYCF